MTRATCEGAEPIWIGLALGGIVTLVALLVWLAGLALALRGSTPADRPGILRAYATLRLPLHRNRTTDRI